VLQLAAASEASTTHPVALAVVSAARCVCVGVCVCKCVCVCVCVFVQNVMINAAMLQADLGLQL